MPRFREYPEAGSVLPTDAFVLDREGVGTMFVEGLGLGERCITYVIDGGGSVLSTGIVGDLYVPFACVVSGATLLAAEAGSAVVDIWAAPFASYPPTIANSIVASAPPTLTASDHAQDTTLTGWTTAIAANSTLRFNVNSVATITRLTVALTVTAL